MNSKSFTKMLKKLASVLVTLFFISSMFTSCDFIEQYVNSKLEEENTYDEDNSDDNSSGENQSGENQSGGNTSGGNTSGDNPSGGNSSGGNQSGGNTSGGNTSGGDSPSQGDEPVIQDFSQFIEDAINYAREKPTDYVTEYLLPLRNKVNASSTFLTYLESCIKEMNEMTPVNPVKLSRGGISKAAQEWCNIQGLHVKATSAEWHGHEGTEGTLPVTGRTTFERMEQYFTYTTAGENIAYNTEIYFNTQNGQGAEKAAYDVVTQLLIDEGIEDFGHRKSLLGKKSYFDTIGVGYGRHNFYSFMCVIDLASGYKEIDFVKKPYTLTPPNEYDSQKLQYYVYDDKIEFSDFPEKNPYTNAYNYWEEVVIENYKVMRYPGTMYFNFYPKDAATSYETLKGVYDVLYQTWYSLNDTSLPDNLSQTLMSQLFSKIDSSIDLTRFAKYSGDPTVVMVPLSQKDELIEKYENYNWAQDKEFSDFVSWMQNHDVPDTRIAFYKKWAQAPASRGISYKESEATLELQRNKIEGGSKIIKDDNGDKIISTGMQSFFDLRQNNYFNVLKNKKIPLLLYFVMDTDSGTVNDTRLYEKDYQESIVAQTEETLENSGLTNDFEVKFALKEYSASKFMDEVNSAYNNSPVIEMATENSKKYVRNWVLENNPELKADFEDASKSLVLILFGKKNQAYPNQYESFMPPFYMSEFSSDNVQYIISSLDLNPVTKHIHIFGEETKEDDALCSFTDCIFAYPKLCPLCLYAMGVE